MWLSFMYELSGLQTMPSTVHVTVCEAQKISWIHLEDSGAEEQRREEAPQLA